MIQKHCKGIFGVPVTQLFDVMEDLSCHHSGAPAPKQPELGLWLLYFLGLPPPSRVKFTTDTKHCCCMLSELMQMKGVWLLYITNVMNWFVPPLAHQVPIMLCDGNSLRRFRQKAPLSLTQDTEQLNALQQTRLIHPQSKQARVSCSCFSELMAHLYLKLLTSSVSELDSISHVSSLMAICSPQKTDDAQSS